MKRRRRSSRSGQRGARCGRSLRGQQPHDDPRGGVGAPPAPPEDRRWPRELPVTRQSLSPPVMGIRRAPPPPPPRSELPLVGAHGGNRSLSRSSIGSSYSCSEEPSGVPGAGLQGIYMGSATAPFTSAKAPPPPRPPAVPAAVGTHGDDDFEEESCESEDVSAASFASGSSSQSHRNDHGPPGQLQRIAVGPSAAPPPRPPVGQPPSPRSVARSLASSESSRDANRGRGGRETAPTAPMKTKDIVSLSPSDDERRWEEDRGCSPPSRVASRSRSRERAGGLPTPGTRAAVELTSAAGLVPGSASVEDKMQRLKDRLTQKFPGGKLSGAA